MPGDDTAVAQMAPTNGQPRVRTYLQGEMDEPDVVRFGIGTVALVSSRSPIKDTPNEDAAALTSAGASSSAPPRRA